jgi:hypothetical protein
MSPTAYNTWQNQHFSAVQILNPNVSGDTATPAGDGINNLLKFALNLNPWTDGVAGLPQPGTVTVGGTNYLSLTYTQVIGATDITYIPEVSVDLKTWNSGTGCTSVVSTTNNLGGLTQTVTVQGLIPLGGAPREFMRLEITGP